MLDELERRNYSPNTVRSYIHAVEEFAKYFHRSPEQLGPLHVREYQVHLFCDRKLSARTIAGQTAARRLLFVKTLRRPYLPDAFPFPKQHKRLPTVLSQEEVARLIDATGKPDASCDGDDALCDRRTPGRVVPAQGRRHLKPVAPSRAHARNASLRSLLSKQPQSRAASATELILATVAPQHPTPSRLRRDQQKTLSDPGWPIQIP
jgi:hypothetical protein